MDQENNYNDYNVNNKINNEDQLTQNLNQKKSFKKVFFVVVLLFVLGVVFYYFGTRKDNTEEGSDKNDEKVIVKTESEDIVRLNSFVEDEEFDNNNDCESLYEKNFLLNLVFGEYDYICPELLPNVCKEREMQYYNAEKPAEEDSLGICNNICFIINYASNDDNYYKEVVEGWKYTEKYMGNDTIYKELPNVPREWSGEKFYPWRVGLAYRLNKIEGVDSICGFFNEEEEKNKCKDRRVYTMGLLTDFEKKCSSFLEGMNKK